MHMKTKQVLLLAVCAVSVLAFALPPETGLGPGMRYATDAYPGFDGEGETVSPQRKSLGWFSWVNGPAKETPHEQLVYALTCAQKGSWRAARRSFDALVRAWPTSPEAPKAQRALADLYLGHYREYENAYEEYRYLLDFYSSQCDYDAVAERLFKTIELMREEGKHLLFFRFANTVDVRRAYEALVVRAPGASFVPGAMLTVASLREDEGRLEKAVQVYENLRNLYPGKAEARTATYREANVRMKILRACEYNRARCRDTLAFLELALSSGLVEPEAADDVKGWANEVRAMIENEAYHAARFYDSRTRTRRSAIQAYERFLNEYPASVHAEEIRQRMTELQGGEK